MSLALTPQFAARVRRDEPLSRHTSWHVGGPAEVFFNPRDREDLAAFLRAAPADVPIHWIGLGSNLLVRDGGLRGIVISAHSTLDALERLSETTVRGEAGVACARIARQCVKWGLGPAEFFAGIPGTLRLVASTPDGRPLHAGSLAPGLPQAGKLRLAALPLPPGAPPEIRLHVEIEMKGGIRRPVRWACRERLPDGSVAVPLAASGDPAFRKGV